jgi:SspJ family small acid-soluble spore protein
MTIQVTLTLPDELYERVQKLASRTALDADAVLARMLGFSLPELDERPLVDLSDDEVLRLAGSLMDTAQQARMSELMAKQHEGGLNAAERDELTILNAIYDAGQARKLDALVEAVKRGLRQRLDT